MLSELIVKFFHGDFTPQGFKRYSGLWKGPPPGNIGKKDIAVGVAKLKEQMSNPMCLGPDVSSLLVGSG